MIMPSKIVRGNRKTISITVNTVGEVVVKAPTRIPDVEIYKFLQEKKDWIVEKQNKQLKLNEKHKNLLCFEEFLLFGVNCPANRIVGLKTANFAQNKCLIPADLSRAEELHKVILVYKRLASKWLKERTLEIARATGLTFDEFKISDTKGRWGCCNSNYCINLNWRVVCLPTYLIDYVIVHELSHLMEMNHSEKFWNFVGKVLPDYKERRKKIKDFGFLFSLYKG